MIFLLVILLIALALVVLPFLAAVVAWNVTDIVNVGPNFWNVFWLGMVAIVVLGSAKIKSD